MIKNAFCFIPIKMIQSNIQNPANLLGFSLKQRTKNHQHQQIYYDAL